MELKTFHESLTSTIYDVVDLFGVLLGLSYEAQTEQDVLDAISRYTISTYWHAKTIIGPWVAAATDDDWRIVNAGDIGSRRDVYRFLDALRPAISNHAEGAIEESVDETQFAHLTISIRHGQMFDSPNIQQALGMMAFGRIDPSEVLPYRYDCCIHETSLNRIEHWLGVLWDLLIFYYSNAFDAWPNEIVNLHRRVIVAALTEDAYTADSLRRAILETLTQTVRQTGISVCELAGDRIWESDKLEMSRLSEEIDRLCQELNSEMMRAMARLRLNDWPEAVTHPPVNPSPPTPTKTLSSGPIQADGPIPPSSFQWRGNRTKEKLTPTEYRLLAYIFERRENPPAVDELKQQFWPGSFSDRGSYDRFATGLRRKLNPIGATIDTDNGHVVILPLIPSDPE